MEIKAFIFVVFVLVLTAGMKIKEIATAIKRGGHVYLGLNLPFLVKVVCLVMIIAILSVKIGGSMGNLGAAETLSLLIMVLLGGVLDKLSAGNKVDDNVTSKYIIAFNAVLISMTVILLLLYK